MEKSVPLKEVRIAYPSQVARIVIRTLVKTAERTDRLMNQDRLKQEIE